MAGLAEAELRLKAIESVARDRLRSGRNRDASDLLEKIADLSTLMFGAEHPDTLVRRSNLAAGYQSVGRVGEAVELLEDVVERSERLLGAEHPDTLRSLGNLSVSYQSVGRVGEAVELLEDVVERSERLLGAEHPDTLVRRSNLAAGYQSVGRVGEAVELLEDVVERSERLLGAEHPDTLRSLGNLSVSYQSVGRVGEAVELLEDVVERSERLLGAEHPDTLVRRSNLAAGYQSVGRVGEAVELLEDVVERSERLLGAEHPDTIAVKERFSRAVSVQLATAGARVHEAAARLELLESINRASLRLMASAGGDLSMAGSNLRYMPDPKEGFPALNYRDPRIVLENIFREEGRYLFGLAYRLTLDKDDAEDLVQETLFRAWRAVGGSQSFVANPRSWLRVTMSRAYVDSVARRHAPDQLDPALADLLASREETVEDIERSLDLRSIVSAMPEPYRLALVLRYWAGMSYEEIAEVMLISQPTVGSRLHRAIRALREQLERMGYLA